MAPKGKQVEKEKTPGKKRARTKNAGSSSTPPPLDTVLWRSVEHERRFRENMMPRNVIRERAVILCQNEFPEIQDQLVQRKWARFGMLLKTSHRTICKEFYANAYRLEEENKHVYASYVRGKRVKYDARTIQKVLKTAYTGDECQYARNLRNIEIPPRRGTPEYENWNQLEQALPVLRMITKPGEQWVTTSNNLTPRLVLLRQLNGLARVWYHFVVSNVMPCSNQAEVILSRAVLIYTIMMGEKINLPVILQNSLYEMAHPTTSNAALGHSGLIQLLCARAGVEIPPIEDKRDEVPLHPTIDAKLIATQLRQGGEGYVGLAPGRKKVADTGTSATTSSSTVNPETRQWLQMVERRLGFLRRRMKFMQTSQQSFQSQMWSMMASVCEAQGIEPSEFHYYCYPYSDEEDAFETEAERYFDGGAGPSQTREDAVPTDGNATGDADDTVPADRNDDDEDPEEYSPMDHEDHGSHTVAAAAHPLALYDPTADDDAEEDDEEDDGEDTD